MRKGLSSLLMAVLLVWPLAGSVCASAAGLTDHITVKSYDPGMDYMAAINRALKDGGTYAMQVGAIYEQQRNLKISKLGLPQKQTSYFSTYTTAAEILKAIEEDSKPKYTEEDLDLLARIIAAEAGSSWIPDWVQRCVGSVVLNRVKSPHYPNTIRGVIYQPGQYPPSWNGMINRKPDARTIANAKYLLENGSITPANVTNQNGVITGSGVYRSYYDKYLGSTMYFCYM